MFSQNFKKISFIIHPGLKKHIFIWISWNTSQNQLKHVSSWSYMKILSYQAMFISLVFWSKCHRPRMILVAYTVCQVCEFKHFLNSNLHEKWQSSRRHLNIHIQASKKFSTLLIFRISSCDSSPSMITSRWRNFERW